ncbi:hypothetical protein OL548_01445 [Lysinibacillus sp. MHQ-1]|nr:hypothetical protein OL548_01445 [Lysinibacillus sp. MHQ-1]
MELVAKEIEVKIGKKEIVKKHIDSCKQAAICGLNRTKWMRKVNFIEKYL